MKEESIFPTLEFEYHENDTGVAYAYPLKGKQGLTKRELFAAFAMQGLINKLDGFVQSTDICEEAVELADNLLRHLGKESK